MQFHNLVFDLYGTLLDIHTEEPLEVWEKTALYFRFYGADYTGEELRTAFDRVMAERNAKAGQSYECFPDIPFEQVLAQLFRERNITKNVDALAVNASQLFRISSIEYLRLYPGVLEALDTLRRKGYKLWLLSNAQQVFTAYELRAVGLGAQFDGVLLSSDYECRKPDIRFYRALLQSHDLDPHDCLMIGNDRETDIAGAKATSMATLYLHTNLTPHHQAPADPGLLPGLAPADCRHYEFEGADWVRITELLSDL